MNRRQIDDGVARLREVLTMLATAEDRAVAKATEYIDVPADHPYRSDLLRAAELGVLKAEVKHIGATLAATLDVYFAPPLRRRT